MLTMLEMMVAVRAYAETHYEEGWDVVVEATDDEELAEGPSKLGGARPPRSRSRSAPRSLTPRWP